MAILRTASSVRNGTSVAEERATVGLTDDLIAEIILKLPVKSVARSKCVAKSWRAAISDDYLCRRLALQVAAVYFPDDPSAGPRFACAAAAGGMLEDYDLDFFPFRDSVVCDACNGLLLLRSASAARFFVVDPVTRRWAELPRPSRDAMLSLLAFDPFASPRFYVLNFTTWRDRGAELEVFSSESWAWSARDADFGVPADFLCGSTHFHDGALYLLAADSDRAVRVEVGGGDLACTVIELPEPVDGDGRVAHSGGRLHYVASDGEALKVWALDAGRQWRLKHAVRVAEVVSRCCSGGAAASEEVRFLALHPEKDAVYLWAPWKLVEYDLTTKEVAGAWEFAAGKDPNGERNRVVKTWLVPSFLYLSDCLADRYGQC